MCRCSATGSKPHQIETKSGDRVAATADGRISRDAGPSLTLARSWRGQGRGSNADASACALKMRGGAAFFLRSEVSDGDAVTSEDVVDVDKGGGRLNASPIITLPPLGEHN